MDAILGRKITNKIALTYHRRKGELYPPYKQWPSLVSSSYPDLLEGIEGLRGYPGMENLFEQSYMDYLVQQAPRDQRRGCCLLLGVNQVIPSALNSEISEQELVEMLSYATQCEELMEGLSQAKFVTNTIHQARIWNGIKLIGRPSRPVMTETNRSVIYRLEDTFHDIIFAHKESSFVYIGGPPGTGKSTVLNWLIEETKSRGYWAANKVETFSAVVTCSEITSVGSVYAAIECAMGCQSGVETVATLRSPTSKKFLFLVLEEVVNLVGTPGGEAVLVELTRMCKPPCNILVAGTGNDIAGSSDLERMGQVAQVKPISFTMGAYNAGDLIKIIREKCSSLAPRFDDKALDLLAQRVACKGGDARVAISSLTDMVSSWDGPDRISVGHVHNTWNGSLVNHRSFVNDLPYGCKECLAVLLHLVQAIEYVHLETFERVWSQVKPGGECAANYLSTMQDNGLVDYPYHPSGKPEKGDTIELSVDARELQFSIDKSIAVWISGIQISI